MTNLGVYVITKNEERLIKSCLSPLTSKFDNVELIDIGSKDDTIDIVKDLNVPLHQKECTPEQYADLKNYYSSLHEWTFFVDGDEIYPEENLDNIIRLIQKDEYTAIHIGWWYVREKGKKKYMADRPLNNGHKIFKGNKFKIAGVWPYETMPPRKKRFDSGKSRKGDNLGTWCWHGKLLTRSRFDDKARIRKRNDYISTDLEVFHGKINWEEISEFPWI